MTRVFGKGILRGCVKGVTKHRQEGPLLHSPVVTRVFGKGILRGCVKGVTKHRQEDPLPHSPVVMRGCDERVY